MIGKMKSYSEWVLSFNYLMQICPECNAKRQFKYEYYERFACCKNCGTIIYEVNK